MRDNGAYTILVNRYQGRASWRFIDAPYQREWLIEQWETSVERLGEDT